MKSASPFFMCYAICGAYALFYLASRVMAKTSGQSFRFFSDWIERWIAISALSAIIVASLTHTSGLRVLLIALACTFVGGIVAWWWEMRIRKRENAT
jgi:hypothetical protein